MVHKNKNHTKISVERLHHIADIAGMVIVSFATVLNMVELAEHEGRQIVSFMQPHYAMAAATDEQGTELRRSGREEIRHTSATYGAIMRSHPTSGTQ